MGKFPIPNLVHKTKIEFRSFKKSVKNPVRSYLDTQFVPYLPHASLIYNYLKFLLISALVSPRCLSSPTSTRAFFYTLALNCEWHVSE